MFSFPSWRKSSVRISGLEFFLGVESETTKNKLPNESLYFLGAFYIPNAIANKAIKRENEKPFMRSPYRGFGREEVGFVLRSHYSCPRRSHYARPLSLRFPTTLRSQQEEGIWHWLLKASCFSMRE